MKNWYCIDLETTTEEDDCRVWAWSAVNIFNLSDYQWGIDFQSMFDYLFTKDKSIWYFRNLKFF